MTITIEEEEKTNLDFSYEELAEEVILFALKEEGFPFEAEISLLLTDNEGIREINHRYRGIDSATDVLSFPMIEYKTAGDFTGIEASIEDNFNPDTNEVILGDIILSIPKVLEQADTFGHSVKREYAFLILHSMLHLFGYDHMTPEEAAFMEHKQEEILKEMNILR